MTDPIYRAHFTFISNKEIQSFDQNGQRSQNIPKVFSRSIASIYLFEAQCYQIRLCTLQWTNFENNVEKKASGVEEQFFLSHTDFPHYLNSI